MDPEHLVLLVAFLLAAWFFFSGYFFGLAPFNFQARLDDEDFASGPPLGEEQTRDWSYANRGELGLADLVRELAQFYETKEFSIFDSDGLLLQGRPADPMLGLKVAGLAQGRVLGGQALTSNTAVYLRDGEFGIQRLSAKAQPLWLVTRNAKGAVSQGDLAQLGQAVDRQWNWAA